MSFKPGDVVQLKSGGPPMTVEQIGKDMAEIETVWCTWSEKVGNRHEVMRATFQPVVLREYKSPSANFAIRRS